MTASPASRRRVEANASVSGELSARQRIIGRRITQRTDRRTGESAGSRTAIKAENLYGRREHRKLWSFHRKRMARYLRWFTPRAWGQTCYQRNPRAPCLNRFDVTPPLRAKAVRLGAVEITTRKAVEKAIAAIQAARHDLGVVP